MKEQALKAKQREMAEIVKKLNDEIEVLDELQSKQNNSKGHLEAIYKSNEALDITGIASYKNFIAKVINDIKNQEIQIRTTKQFLYAKQIEVAEAHKNLKIFEKLKEKQEQKFYANIQYLEAKELDDIASTRYHAQTI